MAPPGPAAIVPAVVPAGSASGLTAPVAVTRSTRANESSVTHSVPSRDAAIANGLDGSGNSNVAIAPAGVIEPTPSAVVNHRRPAGPAVISPTEAGIVEPRYGSSGTGNSVIVPDGVIRATLSTSVSTNQAFPSGPAAIARGSACLVGVANSVTLPPAMRTIRLARGSVANTVPPRTTAIPYVSERVKNSFQRPPRSIRPTA